jgi:hypothetical protein
LLSQHKLGLSYGYLPLDTNKFSLHFMPESPISETLAKLQNPSQNHLSGKPLDVLETLFELSRSYLGGFSAFLEELLRSNFWKGLDYPGNPYPTLCLGLATFIDSYFSNLGHSEPAYHSRKHFQDVCLALTALLSQPLASPPKSGSDDPWAISHEDAWVLLFCAVAHDFGHDGSINKVPFELEKSSIEKTRTFLSQNSSAPDLIKGLQTKFESIILATDPSFLNALLAKFADPTANFTRIDCMSMLMVEADLLASVLPIHGKLLGKLLGQEWESSNPKAAASVASDQGRLKFLEYVRFISPHAIMLKIEEIRNQSIEQLKG